MPSIAEICGMDVKPGCLGIEIETEASEPYRVPNVFSRDSANGWTHVTDGSLRDFGIEYVSRTPVKRDALGTHLKEWKDGLGAIHGRLKPDSHSTSVHVHVNIQNLEPLQLVNFYLSGVLFENILGKFAGPDREGNLFCLRTKDAEHQFNVIKSGLSRCQSEVDLPYHLKLDNYKYANINTGHVTGLGTLEFRIMRGTTNINEIKIFAEVLHDIREFAKDFKNPGALIACLKDVGVEGALAKAFGDNADAFKYNGYQKDISKNLIYLAEAFRARKSWELTKGTIRPTKKSMSYADMLNAAPRVGRAPIPQPAIAGMPIEWTEDYRLEDMN